MCLITTMILPQVASKDIRCYKLMVYSVGADGKDQLTSPFQRIRWKIGRTKKEDDMKAVPFGLGQYVVAFDVEAEIFYRKNVPNYKKRYVEKGFHAATDKDRLLKCINHSRDASGKNVQYVIAACVIPKGARYFIDKTGLIVANKMKVTNVELK